MICERYRFSVVVPVKNRWGELERCMRALARQQDADSFEVLVIDDGSTKPAPSDMLKQGRPFSVSFRRQVGLGIAAARNRGLELAKGEWIVCIDSDSMLAPDFLKRLAADIEQHPAQVAWQARLSAPDSTWIGRMDRLYLGALQHSLKREQGHIPYADTAGFIIRHEYAQQFRDFFPVGPRHGADSLALALLCRRGVLPRFAAEAKVDHVHGGSVSCYILKHFSVGYEGAAGDRVLKALIRKYPKTLVRRREIIRYMWRDSRQARGGRAAFWFVLAAHALKVLGRAAYALVGMKLGRIRVLDIPVDAVVMSYVQAEIFNAAQRRNGLAVTYVNGWTLVKAKRDKAFCRMLDEFDICYPDGIGAVYAAALAHLRRIKKVTANDFFVSFCEEAGNRNLSMAFVGAAEGIAQTVAEQLRGRFPNLEVPYCASGYLTTREESQVLTRLKEIAPHIVVVGRGQPLQEQWVQRCRASIPNTVFFCVGGLFDYLSGRVCPTPVWMRRCGFEWLHRLFHHPKYWYMYVLGIPMLIWYISVFHAKRPGVWFCRLFKTLSQWTAHSKEGTIE